MSKVYFTSKHNNNSVKTVHHRVFGCEFVASPIAMKHCLHAILKGHIMK